MKLGWEIDDYCKYVKMQLGGSLLNIEIEDDLPFIVEKIAFEELKNYIHTVETMTCGYAPQINLTGKNVNNVKYILRAQNKSIMFGMDTNLFVYQNGAHPTINSWAKDRIVYNMQMQQIKNTISSDMDYEYDKKNEILYIYCQHPIPTSITIGYTPDYKDVNEIYIPYWINYLRRFALAYAKEEVGRIRSKYSASSTTYNLDGDKLLAESQQELATIRNELNQNLNISHTIS